MLLEELVACEVITRMLLGRIFRGHTCEGPPYLYVRVPERHSGENIKGYSLSSATRKQQERILWRDIVYTKTIWFVFLLILPRWRVFFLGSPALHQAGTDRLQMVGVCSLHVDRSWILVYSLSWSSSHQQCSTSNTLLKCIIATVLELNPMQHTLE